MRTTISVIIPALNEEKRVEAAIRKAIRLVKDRFSKYEIIAINDGSTDKTGEIIERMSKGNKNIITLHHEKPFGLGYTYKDGLRKARYEYYALVAGDNEEEESTQRLLFNNIGKADIILAYPMNPTIRSPDRRFISNSFTLMMNLLFCLDIPYYTGGNIIRTRLIRNLPIYTNGFGYMPSIIVRLVKSGYTYKPVGISLKRGHNQTKLYRLENMWSVVKEIIRLFMEVRFIDRTKYGKRPQPLFY